MLLLEREIDQKTVLVIPPSDKETVIVTTFTGVRYLRKEPRAKVGYDAPPEVEIDRMEIWQSKQQAKLDKAKRDAEKARIEGEKAQATP